MLLNRRLKIIRNFVYEIWFQEMRSVYRKLSYMAICQSEVDVNEEMHLW